MSRELIIAAHTLSHAARPEWDEFMKVFEKYTHELCVSAVQADPAHTHVAQGRAQEALILFRTFSDLEKTFEALRKKPR